MKGLYAYAEKPESIHGNLDQNAVTWLKTKERMKKATSIDDGSILWFVSGYWRGAAETSVNRSKISGDDVKLRDLVKALRPEISFETEQNLPQT
ncbi:hypothetical protein INT43_003061 [Umbelopsis isabellina]|uniref:Uncharacterized protein n=1 Tax=Mortierella isabellina TaxID=91625 RepID=A0A8H7PQR8_MORIS|nr:hypothetical protein INT43_003061 [Umbelopsis isabellina]